MAGRALRGMLRTADYKGGKALKSCHTEFYHIHSAAFFRYRGGFLLKDSSFFYAVRPRLSYINRIFTAHMFNLKPIVYLWHSRNNLYPV